MPKNLVDASRYHIQVVERALSVLEAVSDCEDGATVTDIASRLGLPFSTVHRLMANLTTLGYLELDEVGRRYTLGMKVLLLRGKMLRTSDVDEQGYPLLRQLARLTGETCHLAVLYDGEVVYVRTAEGPHTTLKYTPPGKRAPAHCTSLGKAMLAYMPHEDVQRILETRGLKAFTPYTITQPAALFAELASIRERGYAVDNEELDLGIRCVGAPVFNDTGTVHAAISLAGVTGRVTTERLPELARAVAQTAGSISQRLGYVTTAAKMPRGGSSQP